MYGDRAGTLHSIFWGALKILKYRENWETISD